MQKKKENGRQAPYFVFSSTRLINYIMHENSCKILYISGFGSNESTSAMYKRGPEFVVQLYMRTTVKSSIFQALVVMNQHQRCISVGQSLLFNYTRELL